VNEALGASVYNLKWTNSGSVTGFDTDTGILDIATYSASQSDMSSDKTLTFTVDAGSTTALCGINTGTQVILHLVTNILQ
jgi:hypothetical protein